ncbi:hypothetical protein EON63_25085 [archaeon]|nr:MAG: hypothetical protein EON63_25085 [archaeon]
MVMDTSVYNKKCFSCSSSEIHADYKSGDVTCLDCGVVQTDCLIDLRSEERFYEDDDGAKISRTSGFADSLGMYTTTFVSGSEKDRAVLERAQRSAGNRKESAVLSLLPMINEMCAQMNLSAAIKVSPKHAHISGCEG